MKKLSILVFIIILASYLFVISSAIAASDEEEVQQLAIDFIKAFNTSDLDLMSSLCLQSPKISTYGPFADESFLIQGWEAVKNNYNRALQLPEGVLRFSLHNPQVTMLTDDVALITGYHIVIVTSPLTSDQTTIQARFTNVVQKIEGKWLLVHEHASEFPADDLE